jgi:hypothetical protein
LRLWDVVGHRVGYEWIVANSDSSTANAFATARLPARGKRESLVRMTEAGWLLYRFARPFSLTSPG